MHPASQMLMFGTARYWSSSFVFCGILVRGSDVIWPFRIFDYMCGLPPQPPRTRHLAHDLGRASIAARPPTPLLPPSRLRLPHTLRLTPCSSLLCVSRSLPLRWLFNGLGYDLYTPLTYDGAFECVPGENVTTDQGIATCTTTGFYCTDASQSVNCFGRTGSQARHTCALPPLLCHLSHLHLHPHLLPYPRCPGLARAHSRTLPLSPRRRCLTRCISSTRRSIRQITAS